MNKRKLLVSIVAGILAAVMVLSLILSTIPASVGAASSSEIKNQINELKDQQNDLKEQMAEIQNQYEANEDEIADMVSQKLVIDQEIFLLYEQIDLINDQLSAYSLLIADKQDELDAAQNRLQELNEKYKARLRAMEEDGELSYWSVLFKANSFGDFLDRLSMVQEIAAADRRRLREISDAAQVVEDAQSALITEKEELDGTKAELDEANEVLQAKNAAAQALIDDLIAKGYELQDLFDRYEEDEKALLEDIALKEQEYLEAKEAEWIAHMATATTAPPPTTKPTTPPAQDTEPGENTGTTPTEGGESGGNQGGGTGTETTPTEPEKEEGSSGGKEEGSGGVNNDPWRVPCTYTKLTSPFGERESPTAGASTNHQGVDLAGPEGTPIYASRGGTVTLAKFGKSAGYYVTINHGDGYSTVYMHMTRYVVSKGDKVAGGQLIGYMGSTGVSTGPHLHWGVIYNGTYVNPANYVYLHP